MRWSVVSIPHTGTHSVLDILGGTVPHLKEMMNIPYCIDGCEYYVAHLYRSTLIERVLSYGYEVVIPMRHPVKTVESWCNWQEKNPVQIENVVGADNLPEVEQYFEPEWVLKLFRTLIWLDELYPGDLNYLPVDAPTRDYYLDKLNHKYNLSLTTNWRPLNSIGEYVTDTPKELREATDNLLKDNKEFFSRFYD